MNSEDVIFRLSSASAILAEDFKEIDECIHSLSRISDPKEFSNHINAIINHAESLKLQAEYVKALGFILNEKVGIED